MATLLIEDPDVAVLHMHVGLRHLVVFAHSTRTARGDVLVQAVDALDKMIDASAPISLLVLTDGGTPPPLVRQRMVGRMHRYTLQPRIAVVSTGTAIRFAIMTLSLIYPHVHCFLPRDASDTMQFLRLVPSDVDDVIGGIDLIRDRSNFRTVSEMRVALLERRHAQAKVA